PRIVGETYDMLSREGSSVPKRAALGTDNAWSVRAVVLAGSSSLRSTPALAGRVPNQSPSESRRKPSLSSEPRVRWQSREPPTHRFRVYGACMLNERVVPVPGRVTLVLEPRSGAG